MLGDKCVAMTAKMVTVEMEKCLSRGRIYLFIVVVVQIGIQCDFIVEHAFCAKFTDCTWILGLEFERVVKLIEYVEYEICLSKSCLCHCVVFIIYFIYHS